MPPLKIPPARVVVPMEDRQHIVAAIDAVLESGRLTLGPHTEEFEAGFAKTVGTRYAVAVNSGTSALEIALRCFGVEGREVVVPADTFFATAAAVVHAGGIPRFADIDGETFALSQSAFEAAVNPQTAGVILVHIGGIVAPWASDLRAECDRRGLFLLEDAAHAHGSKHNGRAAGALGHAAAFSFYPTKVITSGEGGMITTDDERINREARGYRDQGKVDFNSNFHTLMGYNWRLSELHAIVGNYQLKRLDEFIGVREKIAAIYDERLSGVPGVKAVVTPRGGRNCYYKYMVMLPKGVDRAALKKTIREEYSVGLSGEVYDIPLHHQPVFAPYVDGVFPVAEDVCARHVCLPVFNNMTSKDAHTVVDALAAALSHTR